MNRRDRRGVSSRLGRAGPDPRGAATAVLIGGRRSGQGPRHRLRPRRPKPASGRCLEDAQAGDVDGLPRCFAEPLRQRLEREVNEAGRDVFAAADCAAPRWRKSHAIFAVEPEGRPPSGSPSRPSTPTATSGRPTTSPRRPAAGSSHDVETVRSQVPKARYGMPATYQEPEGVPVQGLAVQGIPLRIETDLKPGRNGRGRRAPTLVPRNPFPRPTLD